MAAELEAQREKISQSQQLAENMALLQSSQLEAQKAIEQLKTENEQLRSTAGGDGHSRRPIGT